MQPRLLLIHSPLVGCGSWEPVARELAGDRYAVTVPDLAGPVAAGPPYHLRQAQVIADSAAGQPAILIGHSRAGPLLAAAGALLGEGVRGYVFVDARLPAPGRSWMETVQPGLAARLREMADSQGWLPPWPQWWGEEELTALLPDPAVQRHFAVECPRLPMAMLEEIYPPAPGWPDAPGGYLQLSEAYEDEAARARALGWPVRQQLSHHLALLTEPGQVAREIRRLVGRVARSGALSSVCRIRAVCVTTGCRYGHPCSTCPPPGRLGSQGHAVLGVPLRNVCPKLAEIPHCAICPFPSRFLPLDIQRGLA